MGCGESKPSEPEFKGTNPKATFDTTMGKFVAEIYVDRVPVTASNFVDLVRKGFYDGIHFHRVIPDFMCQFGCPRAASNPKDPRAGTGGPQPGTFMNLATGKKEPRSAQGIKDEHVSKDSNEKGTLSMANHGPNTGGSQFFINVADNTNLDWWSEPAESKHPVFGKIIEGMDIVEAISKVPTNDDNPVDPIKMKKITVEF